MRFFYDSQGLRKKRERGKNQPDLTPPLDYIINQKDSPIPKENQEYRYSNKSHYQNPPNRDYSLQRLLEMQDHTMKSLPKREERKRPAEMGGAWGYTRLGWMYQVLERDLEPSFNNGKPNFGYNVWAHEGGHTNDENETRQVSDWKVDISHDLAIKNKDRSINYDGQY